MRDTMSVGRDKMPRCHDDIERSAGFEHVGRTLPTRKSCSRPIIISYESGPLPSSHFSLFLPVSALIIGLL